MSRKAAATIVKEMESAKKQFSIALPGGNSVAGTLQQLSAQRTSWQAVNVFMADERLVPPDSRDSNYRQANELFFSKARGIHSFPFDTTQRLAEYEKKFLAVTNGKLDMVVLGVGEDGHIASLFPHSTELGEKRIGYTEVHGAPKPPGNRISLTPKTIENAEAALLLFASESKKSAFNSFAGKSTPLTDCPAKIALKAKRAYVFTAFGDKNAE